MLPRSLRGGLSPQSSNTKSKDPDRGFRAELLDLLRDGMESDADAKRLRRLLRLFVWPAVSLGALAIAFCFASICAIALMVVHAGASGAVVEALAAAFGAGSIGKGLRVVGEVRKERHRAIAASVARPRTSSEDVEPDGEARPSTDQGATR